MASTVPAKSQPLHNFSLPHLRWRRNASDNHHRGRSRLAYSSPRRSPSSGTPSPRQSPKYCSPSRASPMRDSAPRRSPKRNYSPLHSPQDESAASDKSVHPIPSRNKPSPDGSKNSEPDRCRIRLPESSARRDVERLWPKSKASEGDGVKDKESRSDMCMRLQKNKIDEVEDDGKTSDPQVEANTELALGDAQEPVQKTWNFRPRKPVYRPNYANGGASATRVGGSLVQDSKGQSPQATYNRSESGASGAEKEKKQKFSISLSKEEIEEDVFAITGSKPARRPKKRPRTVRRTLDNLFPGLWLAWITPDSYKVSDNPPKV